VPTLLPRKSPPVLLRFWRECTRRSHFRAFFFCVAGLAAELQLRVYSHECHSGVTLGHGVEGRPRVMLNSTCRPSPPLVFVLRCVAWPPFNLLSDRPQLGQAADVAGRWWRGGGASLGKTKGAWRGNS
jgi:hypothetical protein